MRPTKRPLQPPRLSQVIDMYYEPGVTPHGLPHDPFKSCVVPRPIGWISTLDSQGRHNLAPYSQFQNVTFDPPIVMFSLFVIYGFSGYAVYAWRKAKGLQTSVIST